MRPLIHASPDIELFFYVEIFSFYFNFHDLTLLNTFFSRNRPMIFPVNMETLHFKRLWLLWQYCWYFLIQKRDGLEIVTSNDCDWSIWNGHVKFDLPTIRDSKRALTLLVMQKFKSKFELGCAFGSIIFYLFVICLWIWFAGDCITLVENVLKMNLYVILIHCCKLISVVYPYMILISATYTHCQRWGNISRFELRHLRLSRRPCLSFYFTQGVNNERIKRKINDAQTIEVVGNSKMPGIVDYV